MSDKIAVSAEKFDDTFMSVNDLKTYLQEHDAAKVSQAKEAGTRAAKARKEYIERLKERIEIPDERIARLLRNAKDAAERGENEVLIGRFPVELCTDHGRAINNSDPDWPKTLTGLPEQAYEVWRERLQPLGYRLKAFIVEWPHGLPGDVGLFLTWPDLREH